jgi:hypothetical protein
MSVPVIFQSPIFQNVLRFSMPAYLLLLAALLSRVLPHSGWYGFTAVGGALLYFGARRPPRAAASWSRWLELLTPVALLAAADYYLTTQVYAYSFQWQDYLVTWSWYAAAIVLGYILLSRKVTVLRVASAAVLGPTAFFIVSNFSVWVGSARPGGMYAPTFAGLLTCLTAGLPFYARDLASTGLILTIVFGAPVAIRRFQENREIPSLPGF